MEKHEINKVKINQNDKQIKCIGTLLEEPSEKEIKEYYFEDESKEEEEDNFII